MTGDDKLTCEPELMSQQMSGKDVVMMSLVRPFTLNFTEPVSTSAHQRSGRLLTFYRRWCSSSTSTLP